MNKQLLFLVLAALIVVGGLVYFNAPGAAADYKNIEYTINGQSVKLVNGVSEVGTAPGSASKITTRYFGSNLKTDLNADGIPDLVFLLTQEGGGSGTFYYVVGAVQNADNSYHGTDGYLLGDRIAPQTINDSMNPQHKNVIVVNYADRAPGEPMTTQPSVGKSVYLKLNPATMQWGIVEADFPGEADPSKMTLDMKTWEWVSTLYNDERVIKPATAGIFTLTFGPDRVAIGTDCNSASASYSADDGKTIAFGPIAATKKFCANSQENDFFGMISNSTSYQFTSRGELLLDLKFDSGTVTFK